MPGVSHWAWGQRARGSQLALSYVSVLSVGLLSWGTRLGLGMLIIAFLVHAFSMCDALRQAAFPGFGRFGPYISTGAGLGLSCYVPAFVAGSLFAWPGTTDLQHQGVLVNLLAYRNHEPRRGDSVWLARSNGTGTSQFARVLANADQEIEWTRNGLKVDSRPVNFDPFARDKSGSRLLFRVPEGQLLVSYSDSSEDGNRWGLVDKEEVRGRAWALLYPIWQRGLIN